MKGVITIMPTAFKEDSSFDEDNYRYNISKIYKTKVNAIMTMGTTGEFFNISFEEYKQFVNILLDEVSGGIKTIVGASGVNLAEAIKRAKYAEKTGADAVINVVPFYQTLNQNEIVKYFTELAKECKDIGIIAYNNHITTNVSISAGSYKKLSKIKNFIGSKEITTDIFYYMSIINAAPELKLLPADGLIVPAAMLGCDGFFSSIVFMNPNFQNDIYKYCKNQEWDKALDMQYKIVKFIKKIVIPLRKKYSEIALAKALINASGFLYVGPPRTPYNSVTSEDQIKIRRDLEKICPYLIYK